jgi:NADPH2:quinone reductase
MRAAVLHEPGVPTPGEFDDPQPDEGHEVARVLVAGLNPVDVYITAGRFGSLPLPSVAGIEGIAELADGRRVYFQRTPAPYGSMAELAPVDPAQTFTLPDGLDPELAVALGIAGLAAWLPLKERAHLQPGERVLILGATGSVGRIGVQAAKLLGAGHVVAAARSREALEEVRELGADDIVVLEGDFAGALREAAGDGYDVVLDPVYGPPLEAALAATAAGGRVVNIGTQAGDTITLPQSSLHLHTLINHSNAEISYAVRRAAYEEMAAHAAAGRLRVPIESFSLDQVAEAWERQATSPHRKLVVVP